MTEINESGVSTNTPDTENENTATIPENTAEITIPVKYNKEIRQLDVETASALAQKGMKYDVISEDYNTLKSLAAEESKSVPQFLADLKNSRIEIRKNYLTEKCGGDSQLAEHILNLEKNSVKTDGGFSELNSLFPEIKTEDDLPQEVVDNSQLKGTLLLDEYLRYRLSNERRQKAAEMHRKRTENQSLGSQINRKGAESPETEEFLKGLWR